VTFDPAAWRVGAASSVDDKERTVPKTVLIPLDGSADAERALPVAEQLAGRFGADIVLVAAQLDEHAPPDRVSTAKDALHIRGVRTEIVRSLSVPDALRAVADDANEPIVCMATHARTLFGQALFGSTAEAVVHALDIPAVLVGPSYEPSQLDGPIVVCVDGSDTSNAIVPLARQWAVALGTRILLVHVFHPLDVATATDSGTAVAAAVELLGTDVEVETRVIRGYSPAATIIALVDEVDASLVALATHGRTGASRVAMGSVTTAVVRRGARPVLVVRPRLIDANPADD
jgi:nucleotide-binding universal stress UspA family protein